MIKNLIVIFFAAQTMHAMEHPCASMTLEAIACECESEKTRVAYYIERNVHNHRDWAPPVPYGLCDQILFNWLLRSVKTKNDALLRNPLAEVVKKEPAIFGSYLRMGGYTLTSPEDIQTWSLHTIQALLRHVQEARKTEFEKYAADYERKKKKYSSVP